MRFLVPTLSALVIFTVAIVLAYFKPDPPQVPTAPARIVQIADWHWTPDDECSPENRDDYLQLVDQLQQQQMEAIRKLDVREIWVEGQSDETIADFRAHVFKLRDVKLPPADSDNPVDQLIRDIYHEDLLQIGAAGRLLLAGEIDDVKPLEDHAAWRAAQPVDCVIDPATNEAREKAMAARLPRRAVIVLGVGHDLFKWLPGDVEYVVERVEALPE
jgi:hypothetical protein